MTDFVLSPNVKSATSTLAELIADVATFDTFVTLDYSCEHSPLNPHK